MGGEVVMGVAQPRPFPIPKVVPGTVASSRLSMRKSLWAWVSKIQRMRRDFASVSLT